MLKLDELWARMLASFMEPLYRLLGYTRQD